MCFVPCCLRRLGGPIRVFGNLGQAGEGGRGGWARAEVGQPGRRPGAGGPPVAPRRTVETQHAKSNKYLVMDQKDEEEGARGPRALRARSWLIIAPKAKRRDIRVVYPLIRWHPYLSNVEFVNSISVQPSIDCCTVLRKTAAKMIRLLYHDVLNFNDAYIYDFGVVLFFRGIKAVGGEGGGVALAVEEDGARRGRSKTLRSSRPSVRPSVRPFPSVLPLFSPLSVVHLIAEAAASIAASHPPPPRS